MGTDSTFFFSDASWKRFTSRSNIADGEYFIEKAMVQQRTRITDDDHNHKLFTKNVNVEIK